MKNKVIRGVLAAACVTTAVSAANVFGAGTEQSLVNEASAVTQEETEETSEAETTDENTPEMTETETPDSTAENAASDLPAAEVQSGKPEETAVSVQAGSYYPWVNENGIWYFKDPDGTIVKGAWREYDKNRYYLNNDGKMAVGWKKLDGAWYYFQSWGGVYRDVGSQFAVILAAILLVVSRELMRDFNEYSMLMLGGLMVLMMIWRPQGLLPMTRPQLKLKNGAAKGEQA